MNRERFAWTVSIILIALLAFHLEGSLAQRDDDYAFVRTLVDIHRQVANNYVEPVDEQQLREGAIEGMLGELDPFTMYVPPARQEEFERLLEGTFKGVGIQLNQLENGTIEVVTPIEGSPAFKAGVMAGDHILKVNGEGIEGLRLPEVIKKIGGPVGTEVTLTVRHVTGQIEDLTMTREEIVVPSVKGYQRQPDNSWDYYICDDPKIAYLRIAQFTPDTFDRVKEAITSLLSQGMQGLILDLRFNPGGRLDQAVQVIDLFLDKGVIVSTKGRSRPEQVIRATEPGTLPYFPMIVLVNEHSASASEIVAGSLMDNRRAVVIGERTYGKGSVQEVIPLDNKGGELKLTVAYYYLPSGRLVHRRKDATDWGVQPQIVVPMETTAERRALEQMSERDRFLRPTTQKATSQPTTADTQQVLDAQLQRAVDTMIALAVLEHSRRESAMAPSLPPAPKVQTRLELTPASQPTTTAPAQ
ncbi:S41 family peptidase [Fontivita pretiosa]|uniref:S41 family peptidase n=1 Tax=Fontivita pretiosa TaxID=2989684 RepID=UPI003D16D763